MNSKIRCFCSIFLMITGVLLFKGVSGALPDFFFVYPSERVYKVNLPSPFRAVELGLFESENKFVDKIQLTINGNLITFNEYLLSGIENLREPVFSIPISSDGNETIDRFAVSFDFGRAKRVLSSEIGEINLIGRPNCNDPCSFLARMNVEYTVFSDFSILRKLTYYPLD